MESVLPAVMIEYLYYSRFPFPKDNSRFSTLDVLFLVSRLPPVFPQRLASPQKPRRRPLGFVCHAFKWMRDKRTPKDVCGEATQRLALLTDFCCISDKRIQVGFLTSSDDFIWISVKRIFVSKGWTKGVHLLQVIGTLQTEYNKIWQFLHC